MELISKPRYFAYSFRGVSLTELVEELPGSNAERWEHFNDHLIAAHVSNCISHKDNNKKLPVGQFYLSRTSLSDIVGRNRGDHSYTKYFEVLKRLGIAYPLQEGKKGYMAGEVCKKYSFTKKQLDLGFNHVQLLSPKVIKRQLKQIEKEAAIESENYADVHFELANMVRKLVIPDYSKAVANLYIKRKSKFTEEETNRYLQEAYRLAAESLGQPVHRFRITVSKSNRRFNTFFTCIAKALRHQARFCDDLNTPLKEYDASCSQWWCFTTLELKKVQGFVAQYFPQHLEAVVVMSQKLALKDDYQLFKELTTKGEFYEYMVEKINSYYQQRFEAGLVKRRRTIDRNYFKSKSMQIIFSQDIAEGTIITHKGRTFRKKISVAEKVFKLEFKYVYQAMKIYRKLMTNSGFACLLQAVESHIWLDGLAGLMIDQGFSDFVTVHDCICIKDTPDNKKQFEACCDYYFREVLRIEKPNIK